MRQRKRGMIEKTKILLILICMLLSTIIVMATPPPPTNEVFVNAVPAEQIGTPGDTLSFNVTVANNGTVPDIIVVDSVTGIPADWMVELMANDKIVSLPYKTPLLQNHTSYSLSLEVHIPNTATSTTESMCIEIHSYADGTTRDNATFWCTVESSIFDTGNGSYPGIMGTHRGTLRLSHNLTVHRMYTYPCTGTGGHSEYAAFYENDVEIANGTWGSYQGQGDYHYIEFTPFVLEANTTYEYKIITGSYPQIHHSQNVTTVDGTITCTEFVDTNGKVYEDGIPAVKLESSKEKSEEKRSWGRIANPSHRGEMIYTTLFFSGPSLGPKHEPLYSRHPLDESYLRWGEENTSKQISKMRELGLNTIKVSYWNPEGIYSPMKSDLKAIHDTFEIAEEFDLLVVPFIEDNYYSSNYMFWTHFPQNTSKFEEKLIFLINEFSEHENWLKMYNKDGEEKMVFWLINSVASRPVNEKEFADTFDEVAQRVREKTGKEIGFVIDFTATGPYAAEYGINPNYLEQQKSILAFNPFNPFNEGKGKAFGQTPTEKERVDLVEEKYLKVIDSRIPTIYAVMAGFDDTKLSWRLYREKYGYNDNWLSYQEQLASQFAEGGLSFDCWNGYTEGFVIAPTKENETKIFDWAKEMVKKHRQKILIIKSRRVIIN
jgi:hypothetical protein